MSEQAFGPEQDAEVLITPIRRRPRSRKSVYSRPVDYSRIILTAVFMAALAAGAAYYVYANYLVAHAPYAVSIDGRVLAVLGSREDAMQALRDYRARYAPKAPGVVAFVEGEPLIRPHGKASDVVASGEAMDLLGKHLTPMYDGYAIFVNKMPMALLATQEEALQAVSLMLERGLKGKPGIPTFKQRVTIDHLRLDLDEGKSVLILSPVETAAELVRSPRPRVHIVDLGDNFWKIATANGITVDDLKELNPGVNYKALHKGDRIKLPDSPSPVTVVVRAPARERQPTAAAPPKVAPEPANSGASAENRAPVNDDGAAAKQSPPPPERGAADNPAPAVVRREPRATHSEPAPVVPSRPAARPRAPETRSQPAPAAPSRPTVRPRAPERRSEPAPTRPPARRQPPAPERNPDITSPSPTPPSSPKSYNDGRMPLKNKAPADNTAGE